MTPRQIALMSALAGIWGGSYLLIKYALEDLSAPMIVFTRTVIAALVLLIALRGAARGALADLRRRPGAAAARRWRPPGAHDGSPRPWTHLRLPRAG